MNFNVTTKIHKSATLKRVIVAAVLIPDVLDLQNDWMTKDDVQEAAWNFLAQYNKTTKLGLQHGSFPVDKFEVVESFLVPDGNSWTIGEDVFPEGTWILAVRVLDDGVWLSIESGEITGFSVGGKGVRLEAAQA